MQLIQENASLAESLASLNETQRAEVLKDLTPKEATALEYDWPFWARPKQLPPHGDWRIWLILAGRGFGKTASIVQWAHTQARKQSGSRGAIVGSTAADVRDILVEGESGILATAHPDFRPQYKPSIRRMLWPNGSVATLFSADEPDRLRGPQHQWAICDEISSWRYGQEAWDMLMMGLRLGDDPRCAVATTPRPIPLVKQLLADISVSVTRGTTYENRGNLAPAFFQQIITRYEGTRLGRQELNAELLEDVEGALWNRSQIDDDRVKKPPAMSRIVVAVDPKASQVADSESGIVVVGLGVDGHGYILADYSLNGSPEQWAAKVATADQIHEANVVVAERNNGGDMVRSVLAATGVHLPLRLVWASRGKQTRAEPVVALYEQHRVHHVGVLPQLEDQLCSWLPSTDESPDRLDALVWGVASLMLRTAQDDEIPASSSRPAYR